MITRIFKLLPSTFSNYINNNMVLEMGIKSKRIKVQSIFMLAIITQGGKVEDSCITELEE